MTELNEHRRDLIKADTISGTTTTVETDSNEIYLPDATHTKLQTLSFEGNTIQKTTTGNNLIDVEKFAELIMQYHTGAKIKDVDGRRCIFFSNNLMAFKNFTACCPTFKEKTRYIFSFEAKPNTQHPADAQYDGALFMGFKPTSITAGSRLSGKTTTEFTRMYSINYTATTPTDINLSYGSTLSWLIDLDTVYLYEYDGNNDPPYEEYTGRIPSPNAGQVIINKEYQWETYHLSTKYEEQPLGGINYVVVGADIVSLPKYPAKIKIEGTWFDDDVDNMVVIGDSKEDLFIGTNMQYLLLDGVHHELTVTEDFYIGVGYRDGIPSGQEQATWETLVDGEMLKYENEVITKTEIRAFPQPIENSTKVSAELSGANIIDIETLFPTMYFGANKCWEKKKDGTWYCFNVGMLHNIVLYSNTSLKQGSLTITVCQKSNRDDERKQLFYLIYYTDGTIEKFSIYNSTEFKEYSFTTNSNKTVENIKFSYEVNTNCTLKYLMISWGARLPYQPYTEPVTVTIPSEVTLADGTVVPLRFAKLGTVNNVAINKADTLTIDKIANKVTYTQYLDLFRPQAPYNFKESYYNYANTGVYFVSAIPQKSDRQQGICSHGGRVGNYWSPLDIWVGVSNTVVYWLGIITHLGYDADWVDKANPTTEEWAIAKQKMEDWFAEQEANGTPFEVLYELPTPIEYDITGTGLGWNLLEWARTKKGTNKISLTSDGAEVSHIKATYYSDKHEDKLELVVRFKNESGVEIKDAQLHQVRANSKYTYLAPSIDGYVSSCDRVEGYMTQATEITIVYKEK